MDNKQNLSSYTLGNSPSPSASRQPRQLSAQSTCGEFSLLTLPLLLLLPRTTQTKRMTISQVTCAKLLKRATNERDVTEVLSAYLYCKYLAGGSSTQVLRKLQLLTLYLRAIGMNDVLELFGHVFTHNAYHVQVLNGGSIGSTPACTEVGKEAWNECRRETEKRKKWGRVMGGDTWGSRGPAPVRNLLMRTGSERSDLSVSEEEVGVDVARLTPFELERIGASALPHYRTGTLPNYERGEEI